MPAEFVLPEMHEALMKKNWYQLEFNQSINRAAGNPWINTFLKEGMKEGILSDMAAALGKIHDVVVDAAKPDLIGRQLLETRTTMEALERFVKAKNSVAYVGTEGGLVRIAGERYETVDIQTNIIVKDGVEWTREFAEDAKWNVMNRQLQELGRSVAEKETALILALIHAIGATDLAGGAVIAGGGLVMTWAQTVAMWDAVEGEDFEADTMALHPKQVSQLFTATEFINSQYLPASGVQLGKGMVGSALTMNLFKSSKCTNGIVHALAKYPAGILLIRRDITTEPYEDPKNGMFGITASERIGYGILRSDCVARGTNFKLTL